jgi:hypothetical protein
MPVQAAKTVLMTHVNFSAERVEWAVGRTLAEMKSSCGGVVLTSYHFGILATGELNALPHYASTVIV